MSQFCSSPYSDPKRQYRFCIIFGDFEPWVMTGAGLPSYSINEATHAYLNHTFKFPGRITWNDVTIKMRDPALPDTSQAIMKMLKKSGYYFPDAQIDLNNKATVSKAQAIGALGSNSIKIQLLDGPGKVITQWEMMNAWVKDFKQSDLDYTSDDLIELELVITYDWARSEHFAPNLPTG